MAAVEALKTRLRGGDKNLPTLYDGEVPALDTIRAFLGQFKGGSVDLTLRPDGIAVVTLNHPERRNALSGTMMGELQDVVNKLELWKEGKGVILRGSNGNFCSGGDLNLARGTGDADGGFKMAVFMDSVLSRFQTLPLITVALIEGCGALGGGSEISVACDYRLMAPNCQGIGFVHGRMGIVPAWGGTQRLVGLIGYRSALQVLTSAQVYPPEDAKAIGLVDEITSSDVDPQDHALEWLLQRTRLLGNVIRAMKISSLMARGDPDISDLEKRIFAPFWGSDGNKAALASNIKHKSR